MALIIGISDQPLPRVYRPALYILFKSKDNVLIGVYLQWVDETIDDVKAAMKLAATFQEKTNDAFRIWALHPFEMAIAQAEAQELIETSFGFAESAHRDGYARFEATIAPILAEILKRFPEGERISPGRLAQVLTSAARRFKLTAATPDELRRLIKELLLLSFGRAADSGSPNARARIGQQCG